MNVFDVKCYQKTYQNPKYWENNSYSSIVEQQQAWANCRAMTDNFYSELVSRGYLVPLRKSNQ